MSKIHAEPRMKIRILNKDRTSITHFSFLPQAVVWLCEALLVFILSSLELSSFAHRGCFFIFYFYFCTCFHFSNHFMEISFHQLLSILALS